jgi:NAD(P)-dependent dehydrogenase (short-subunit alcohol dehydrogenase family)
MNTYLIIGASRGLGLEFVRQVAATPVTLILATHRAGGNTPALAGLAEAHPETVKLFELDFTSQESLDALVPRLPKVDRLVVNAGYNGSRDPLLFPSEGVDMAADLAETFRINTIGPVR